MKQIIAAAVVVAASVSAQAGGFNPYPATGTSGVSGSVQASTTHQPFYFQGQGAPQVNDSQEVANVESDGPKIREGFAPWKTNRLSS
ncbi:MAG: hypothetical protein AAF384_16060 [Pseudomonadota bacterium]